MMEPAAGWEETHQLLYGSPWDPSLGLVIFEFDFEDITDVEGVWVWVDVPYEENLVFDSAGELVVSDEILTGTDRAQLILTGVSPAPANVEVTPRDGVTCLGPDGFDTLDNAILYALYTCRRD